MNRVHCSQGHSNPAGNRFCQYCGESMIGTTAPTLPAGLVLGDRYRVVRQLAQGGFGRTYLAQDTNRSQELCVLKEFAPQLQGDYALQKAQELFEREARVLYKLEHPQIPRFRELFRVSDRAREGLFLVQDYADGQTYATMLNSRKQQGAGFTEAEIIDLFKYLLPVLAYIHSMGVIHRDISPDNLILRASDRKPVLIDFGCVKEVAVKAELQYSPAAFGGQSTIIPTRLGKAGYAPKEQMQRGVVSPPSDLYALAATALALLTGKEPNELIDTQTLSWNWAEIGQIDPRLANILDKMLSPNPSDRYASAPEVLRALHPPAPAANVGRNDTIAATIPFNPLPTAGATVAFASAVPEAASKPPKTGIWRSLSKILLGLLIVGGAGVVGWLGGTWWIRSEVSKSASSPTPTPTTSPTPALSISPTTVDSSEAERQQALQKRRQDLELEPTYYQEVVNQVFEILNPAQKGKILSNAPEDANLRSQRDKVAGDLLAQIGQANLTPQIRKDLGTYNSADRQQWIGRVNRANLSSRSLNDLVDAKFNAIFPQYTAKTLNLDFNEWLNTPIGQLWYAIAGDTVPLLESKKDLERVEFAPGATTQQLNGTLNLGEGKAYISQLKGGQVMELKLDAPPQVLISVYSPSGKAKILEDSTERTWYGNLLESGYYELVITSNAPQSTNYQLNVTVRNSVQLN